MLPVCFLLPVPDDFNFGECLWFLDRGFDDCLYQVDRSKVKRAIRLKEGPAVVQIEKGGNAVVEEAGESNLIQEGQCLKVSVNRALSLEEERELKQYIADWFDLQLDLNPFYARIIQDPRLSFMKADYFGLRLIGIPDLFEAICWAIIGQQINLTFAYKLKRKLVERYGSQMDFQDNRYLIFPEPAVLAKADTADLQAMQFSRSKANYVLQIAAAFADQRLSKEGLRLMPDLSARQKALISIKGVGVWTANYALMKSLKERSCIPHGDAGLLNALINLDIIKDKKDVAGIEAFFTDYEGWESYLVFYLWRTLSKRV
ncbi:DNA-3-methyladenine glycosylase family protein [Pedobacter gandavensis]|uniref:DNA-3-methyladenine glycosylase II n=1 Tax=Pedobacter gandavensis TaxID=2679963 RepID=A0ABR6EW39_9SPHI|nr:DNA-3-methyladenine glycosylase 2 family protein [Pedobacter gandavensis]MBB2149493.1 DNA repair protein [Pedobacter gandavensis]